MNLQNSDVMRQIIRGLNYEKTLGNVLSRAGGDNGDQSVMSSL